MKTKLVGFALFALTAAAVAVYPTVRGALTPVHATTHVGTHIVAPPHVVLQRPKIEVVFALDTTSSMSGLIDAAKEKIWSIASTMAAAQPAPEIRMGLVAFRDRGDAYVTRVFDLTDDLDSMYATLMDFKAEGGGDTPESVNAALVDAVHSISWSDDPDAYQVIFLVGDSPPHMDYAGEVTYPEIMARASNNGIVVNAIRCGTNPETEQRWREIAGLTQGAYFSVDQAGSAIAITTPFDTKIAGLSAALDDTRMYYGSEEVKEKQHRKVAATAKLHEKASDASRARRAAFNASASGAANRLGENELISAIVGGRVDLADLAEAELPASLQAIAPEERDALVKDTAAKRDELTRQIDALAQKRENYLAEQVAEAGGYADSLDQQLFDAVRVQAGKKGLEYEAGPKY